jgi:hypothetical protein
MAQPFGKLNPRPVYTNAPAALARVKAIREPISQATMVLIAYVAGAIALLCLAAFAFA